MNLVGKSDVLEWFRYRILIHVDDYYLINSLITSILSTNSQLHNLVFPFCPFILQVFKVLGHHRYNRIQRLGFNS